MHVATVIGSVWATKKDASLDGLRLLVVRPYTTDGKPSAETMIAADPIGAGEGERCRIGMLACEEALSLRHDRARNRGKRGSSGRHELILIRVYLNRLFFSPSGIRSTAISSIFLCVF